MLNFRKCALLIVTVGHSFFATSSLLASECQNAGIADEKTEAFGQEFVEVDCRLISGTVEFQIIHQFIQDGGPVEERISFFPKTNEKQGFRVKSLSESWCTDSDGIAVVDVEINCDTTEENHLYG